MLLVLVVGVVACVVLFVTGVFSVDRSHRLQRWYNRQSGKAESKSDASGGRAGDFTRDSLKKMRHATDKSAKAGRSVHRKAADEEPDA